MGDEELVSTKGWIEMRVVVGGAEHIVTVFDRERFNQELLVGLACAGGFVAYRNLIVLEKIVIHEVEGVLRRLSDDGYFD